MISKGRLVGFPLQFDSHSHPHPPIFSLTHTLFFSLRLLPSEDSDARIRAEETFASLVAWAGHLSLPGLYIPAPSAVRPANLARMMREALLPLSTTLALWLELPLTDTVHNGLAAARGK